MSSSFQREELRGISILTPVYGKGSSLREAVYRQRTVSTYRGYTWLIITVLDWMIGFTDTSITITLNFNNYNSSHRWLSRTPSIPYWTTSVFSSTVTDSVLIHESVTSSASVVRWLTLHSWTLLTNADFCTTEYSRTNASCNWLERINYVSFYKSVLTEDRISLEQFDCGILCVSI
jgi:hypothetical protein